MNDRSARPHAAIFTWCYNNGRTNYGQILQCYAMQVMLQRLGYDTKVIRYRKRDADESIIMDQESGLSVDLYELWYRLEKVERKVNIRILKFIQFIKENITMSAQCYTKEQVEKECQDCDILVCGSDQIWNPLWFDDVYALNFGTSSQKRIAYAASGVFVEDEKTRVSYERLGACLDCFDLVTVREKKSVGILKKYTKQDVIDVVDPTLVLDQEEWNRVAAKRLTEEPYILCYSMGRLRTHKVLLKRIMKKYNASKILFITSGFYDNEDELETGGYFYPVEDAGPAEFIALIRDAEAVCTDSFHGLALSIIYKKQFYILEKHSSIANLDANLSRQENLLEKVGIKGQRMIKCVRDMECLEALDYSRVNLNQFRNEPEKLMEKVIRE